MQKFRHYGGQESTIEGRPRKSALLTPVLRRLVLATLLFFCALKSRADGTSSPKAPEANLSTLEKELARLDTPQPTEVQQTYYLPAVAILLAGSLAFRKLAPKIGQYLNKRSNPLVSAPPSAGQNRAAEQSFAQVGAALRADSAPPPDDSPAD